MHAFPVIGVPPPENPLVRRCAMRKEIKVPNANPTTDWHVRQHSERDDSLKRIDMCHGGGGVDRNGRKVGRNPNCETETKKRKRTEAF